MITQLRRWLVITSVTMMIGLQATASAWGTGRRFTDPWGPQPSLQERVTDWLRDMARENQALMDPAAAETAGRVLNDQAGSAARAVADAMNNALDTESALSDMDRALDDARSRIDTDSPPIPVSCDGNAACMDCYHEALEQLARQRILLARLNAVYVATHRFADTARATGDSLAGIHPAGGVGWHGQKIKIAKSLDVFDQTYDKKFEGMMKVLREALMKIDACEAKHFNNRDWYTRFGFMYYEFLEARYRRPGA